MFHLTTYQRNSRVPKPPLCLLYCSERALLNRLMIELYKLDSDVLVGHNISGFDLDVLLHRAEVGIFQIFQSHILVNSRHSLRHSQLILM